ncbi:MAG: orotate phosphoribosyltransferase [Rhodobacteraceae bacterium]|nr:orotate phosphoribosyltransferase [Paracoccaceae bacterium]
MINNIANKEESIARITSKLLLDMNAIHFSPKKPFTLTSGIQSPVYIDCRKIISYPKARKVLMDFCADIIAKKIGIHKIDTLVGGETAGIPFAAFLAERLKLPMNYVRKKPKGFGRDAQIEGESVFGKRAILIEDLSTDGGSKISFCNALRGAGAEVADTIVIFYYNIFKSVPKKLAASKIELHYLASWWDILNFCKEEGSKWNSNTLDQIETFLRAPQQWSEQKNYNVTSEKNPKNVDFK